DPAAALPLASRAYVGSVQDPAVADTLAWVQHLLGRDATAELIISKAIERRSTNPDFMVHAAFIFLATGKTADAQRYLAQALKLDPKLEQRPDVQELRA